jgi:hypothetical protein
LTAVLVSRVGVDRVSAIDPGRIAEMARTTATGGVVAASVWDHARDKGPLSAFWSAARSLDLSAPDESDLQGVTEGHLVELFTAAGLSNVASSSLTVTVEHSSLEGLKTVCTRVPESAPELRLCSSILTVTTRPCP